MTHRRAGPSSTSSSATAAASRSCWKNPRTSKACPAHPPDRRGSGRFTAQRFRFPAWKCRRACSASIRWAKPRARDRLHRPHQPARSQAHRRLRRRANYNGTDHIGKEGLEKSYEKQLHGTTGYEEVEVSAGGRAMRTLSRTPATPGNNLILSIDIELQKVVEAFGDRRARWWRSTRKPATSWPMSRARL
jgi:hypothetical protein